MFCFAQPDSSLSPAPAHFPQAIVSSLSTDRPSLKHPLDAHRHSCQSWSPGVPSLLQPAPTFLINPADIRITHFHLFPVRSSYVFFTEHSCHFTCLFDLVPELWTPSFLLAPRLVLVCLALLVCLVSWLPLVYLWALHLGPTHVFFFFFKPLQTDNFPPRFHMAHLHHIFPLLIVPFWTVLVVPPATP